MLLAALAALGPFATDAYLPSFREIGHEFGATPVLVQQTLTAYMVPFAAMTLWQGAISDALGRRRVTLAMLAVFFIASLGCMTSWNIGALIGFRALQGMSAGAGMIIGRAIVRDLLDGTEARRLMSRIAVMFAIAPALGPIVGGWLHVWFGWRSVFAFLALFTAILWWSCWRALPETLPPARRLPLHAGSLLRGYWQALRSAPFVTLVLAITLNFSALFIYIVSAPAFLLGLLHVEETEFYWLFGPITGGMLIGTWLSGRLAGRLSNRRTVALAYGFMATAALGNLTFHLWHAPALPWSILPLVVYVLGCSLSMPSLTLLALDLFPERRGLASSCQGFVQSSGNALVTALLAPLLWGTGLALSLGMLALFAGGAAAFGLSLLLHKRSLAPNDGSPVAA
ncbi:MAG: multidrug effflux MFS transporter [Opitutaceae bacterium]|nr:multidrug effflux MFS transporter [Opitutaceae bacterium]